MKGLPKGFGVKLRFVGGPMDGEHRDVLVSDPEAFVPVVGRFSFNGGQDQAYRIDWSEGVATHLGTWASRLLEESRPG